MAPIRRTTTRIRAHASLLSYFDRQCAPLLSSPLLIPQLLSLLPGILHIPIFSLPHLVIPTSLSVDIPALSSPPLPAPRTQTFDGLLQREQALPDDGEQRVEAAHLLHQHRVHALLVHGRVLLQHKVDVEVVRQPPNDVVGDVEDGVVRGCAAAARRRPLPSPVWPVNSGHRSLADTEEAINILVFSVPSFESD